MKQYDADLKNPDRVKEREERMEQRAKQNSQETKQARKLTVAQKIWWHEIDPKHLFGNGK